MTTYILGSSGRASKGLIWTFAWTVATSTHHWQNRLHSGAAGSSLSGGRTRDRNCL